MNNDANNNNQNTETSVRPKGHAGNAGGGGSSDGSNSSRSGMQKPRLCFNCREEGHVARRCPKQAKARIQSRYAPRGSGGGHAAVARGVTDMHHEANALRDVVRDVVIERNDTVAELRELIGVPSDQVPVATAPDIISPVAVGESAGPIEPPVEACEGVDTCAAEFARRAKCMRFAFPAQRVVWYHWTSLYILFNCAGLYVNVMFPHLFSLECSHHEDDAYAKSPVELFGRTNCSFTWFPDSNFRLSVPTDPTFLERRFGYRVVHEPLGFWGVITDPVNIQSLVDIYRKTGYIYAQAFAAALVCFCLWNFCYHCIFSRFHVYKFSHFVDHTHGDMRADSISLGELKHLRAEYAIFNYYRPWTGRPWDLRSLLGMSVDRFLVSLELFTQLTTASVMDLNSGDAVAWEKIKYTSKSLHSINLDRLLTTEKHHVVHNTQLLALACYRNLCYDRSDHVFPQPLLM